MQQLIWKNKLVVLWILQILNFIAVLVIPESFEAIVEQNGENIGALIAFYFFLTCLMIGFAVFMKPTLSRWPFILVGIFYAIVKCFWIISALTGDVVIELLLTEIWGFVAAVMIVWYGWKGPKPEFA